MGKDTSGGAVSGGVAGIGQLPSFTLPTAGGGQVRSWDFKSRTALVLWLAGASPSERAVRLVAAKEPDVLGAPAALLIIVRGPLAQAEAVRRLGGSRNLSWPTWTGVCTAVSERRTRHSWSLTGTGRSTGVPRSATVGPTWTKPSPGWTTSASWSPSAGAVSRPGPWRSRGAREGTAQPGISPLCGAATGYLPGRPDATRARLRRSGHQRPGAWSGQRSSWRRRLWSRVSTALPWAVRRTVALP